MNHDALINQINQINQIAREMTEAEPPADFRARVLAGITPRRRWPRVAVRAVMVAAAAAICAWALVPAKRAVGSIERPDRVAQAVSPPPQPMQTVDQPGDLNRLARIRVDTRAASAEELAWRARALPPLPPVAPLAMPSIQPQALSIAPIIVHPIVSHPLTLGAVDARSGGR